MNAKKVFIYALIAYVLFVFLQSLPYKFSAHEETQIIFTTIADWMKTVGLGAIAPAFAAYGGYLIGGAELLASVLIIIPATRRFGALFGLGIISGAIFFHLFTPLGVVRVIDDAGNTDGGILFFMACGVWVACALLIWLCKPEPKRRNDYR